MLRILLSLLVVLLMGSPALAEGLARPSGFFAAPSGSADADATYFTLNGSSTLVNERLLTFTDNFNTTDNGAGMTYVVDLATVGIIDGGTGATTQQGAVNNILDYAGKASGDIIYYNGTNWTRLAKGSDTQVLTLSSGLPIWSSGSTGAPADSTFLVQSLSGSLSNERRLQGTSGDITLTDGGANADMVIGIGTNVVTLTGTQTLTNKTLTGPAFSWNSGNGVTLKGQVNDSKLTWADFASAKTINFPDISGDVVMTAGAQTIGGVKTFSSAPTLSTGTLTAGANLQTFPSSAQTLVGRTSTDTLTNKTLTSPILQTQMTLDQTTADYTLTWENPAAGRAYRIRDVNSDAAFAMTYDTAVYAAGAVAFANGDTIDFTGLGSVGQALISQGSDPPIFGALPITGGGTGISSYTAGDILTADDANTLVRLPGGSNGQVLTYDAAGDPNVKWANPQTFGGSGVDGDVAITTAVSQDVGLMVNAHDFTVTNAGSFFIFEYTTFINATGAITVDGQIVVDRTEENGGNQSTATNHTGPGADGGGIGRGSGAKRIRNGGDGAAGTTSYGGYGGASNVASERGAFTPPTGQWLLKSGGGGEGWGEDGMLTGGGSGLPSCVFIAVGPIDIQDEAILFADAHPGDSGGVGDKGGCGGGACGNWCMYSQDSITIDADATIRATGGLGGAGGSGGNTGGGGGGAGGCILLYAPSVTNSATPNLAGGTAGAGSGTGDAGFDGDDGSTVVVIGTPNTPILGWLHNEGGLAKLASGEITTHKDVCRAVAAGDIVRYFEVLTERTTTTKSTCLGIGDSVALRNAA